MRQMTRFSAFLQTLVCKNDMTHINYRFVDNLLCELGQECDVFNKMINYSVYAYIQPLYITVCTHVHVICYT